MPVRRSAGMRATIALLIFSLLLVPGFSEAKKKKKKKKKPEPVEVASEPLVRPPDPEPYVYLPGRRDPFKSPLREDAEVKAAILAEQKPLRAPEPLEQFPLDSLELVAILLRVEREPLAMVQDPSGKGYTVRVGNYLGTQEGKIVRIGANEVELVENAPTVEDTLATRTTVLRLRDLEETE